MSEWKPIETAPKDGTWILVHIAEDEANWISDHVTMAAWVDGDWLYLGSDGVDSTPIHWALVPAPPQSKPRREWVVTFPPAPATQPETKGE